MRQYQPGASMFVDAMSSFGAIPLGKVTTILLIIATIYQPGASMFVDAMSSFGAIPLGRYTTILLTIATYLSTWSFYVC